MAAGDRYFLESDSGESTEITADTLIGRSEKCDFKISRGYLSRRHAQLSITNEGAVLEDLGSVNGTFVNGKKLSTKRLLKHGDTLAFDTCEYRFVWEKAAPPEKKDERTVIRSMAELEQLIESAGLPASPEVSVGESPAVKPLVVEPQVAKPAVTEPPVIEPPVDKTTAEKLPVVKPPVAKATATKPPVVEPQAAKTPADKPPVIDPPAAKTTAAKQPVVEPQVAKTPADKPPVIDPPAAKTTAAQPPVVETTVAKTTAEKPLVIDPPATKTPAAQPPVVETPVAKTTADKPPVIDPPATKTPAAQPPVVEPPVAKTTAADTPVAKSPTFENPVADRSIESSPGFEEKATTGAAPKPGSWADPEKQNYAHTKMVPIGQLEERISDFTDLSSNSAGPYLKVGNGLSKGLRIQLASTDSYGEWTIGCDTSRDIIFTDDGVSGYHAKIVNEGSRWKLVDQMSTNGSFINDKKSIAGYLNSGDRIRIGKIECVLVLPEGSSAANKVSKNKNVLKGVASFVVVLCLVVAAYMLLG